MLPRFLQSVRAAQNPQSLRARSAPPTAMHHISTQHYPFTAIVGQERLKTALLLNAINPLIGGVLIRGAKGTAKSTAARALAEVLPEIEAVADCSYSCHPENMRLMCDRCAERFERGEALPRAYKTVPFITLPLSATEDRLAGTIDVTAALSSGTVAFKPGLLAEANRGILYVDEVNLLDDHLVNLLLDAAAMGRNIVEREGISAAHPARFILIGTMNPEEGELRPQLLDRFGITVDVETIADLQKRVQIITCLDRYDRDSHDFIHEFEPLQKSLRAQISTAMAMLPAISVRKDILEGAARRALEAGVDGHRADMALVRVAVTLAALRAQESVSAAHLDEAAPLVLTHRLRKRPFDHQPPPQVPAPPLPSERMMPPGADSHAAAPSQEQETPKDIIVDASLPESRARGAQRGTGAAATRGARGKKLGTKALTSPDDTIVVAASLLSTAMREGAAPHMQTAHRVTRDDIKARRTRAASKRMICFVADTSGSMGARQRIDAVRLACRQLLEQSYRGRHQVMLVTAGGNAPQLLIPPTRDVELVDRTVKNIKTGGKTPLAEALFLAADQLAAASRKGFAPCLVLLTDGRSNVPLRKGGDPVEDAYAAAEQAAKAGIDCLVVDTENDFVRLGVARELAVRLGAHYLWSETADSAGIVSWARQRL